MNQLKITSIQILPNQNHLNYSQMKKLENPTTFFFHQADHITDNYTKEIDDFVNKLVNKNQCQLCLQNYDILVRLPRIMIHCGHTFCTPCLRQFYMNRRVRCPMCLKLVKQLDKLERLPINHTIYKHLVQKDKEACQKTGIKPFVQDADKVLFAEFEKAQKEAHMKEKPQKIDPDSGLPFCVFHPDRVEHFYCAVHSSAGCRVCSQIGHSKPQCKVVDLYEIEDPNQLAQMVGKSKIEHHGVSNQHQIQSSEEDQNIIIDDKTGGKYFRTKAGNLLPLNDDEEEQNINGGPFFGSEYMSNGQKVNFLEQNFVDDDSDDE